MLACSAEERKEEQREGEEIDWLRKRGVLCSVLFPLSLSLHFALHLSFFLYSLMTIFSSGAGEVTVWSRFGGDLSKGIFAENLRTLFVFRSPSRSHVQRLDITSLPCSRQRARLFLGIPLFIPLRPSNPTLAPFLSSLSVFNSSTAPAPRSATQRYQWHQPIVQAFQ